MGFVAPGYAITTTKVKVGAWHLLTRPRFLGGGLSLVVLQHDMVEIVESCIYSTI
jgi:hypothetical protein